MKKVFLMLAVVAMASCSKSELSTRPVSDENVEIKAGSTILSIDTKAPFGPNGEDISSSDFLTTYVMITKDVTNGSYKAANFHGEGYMKFVNETNTTGFYSDNTCATEDKKYYPADNSPIAMAALVPAKKNTGATSQDGWKFTDAECNVISYVINGSTDVMAAVVTEMNDAASMTDAEEKKINKTNAKRSDAHPEFNFKHLLTLINVKAVADKAEEAAAFGKITKIELVQTVGVTGGVNSVVNVNLKDGKSAAPSTVVTAIPFYAYNSTDKYTEAVISTTAPVAIPVTTAAQVAYAMIVPFTAVDADGNLKLKVYTENNTAGIDAPISKLYSDAAKGTPYTESTEGKKFDVTLKFIGSEIKASATVADWVPVYSGDVEIK